MAETSRLLRYRRANATIDIKLYNAQSDVDYNFLRTQIGGQTLYPNVADLGSPNDSNMRIRRGNTTYQVSTEAVREIDLPGHVRGMVTTSIGSNRIIIFYTPEETPNGSIAKIVFDASTNTLVEKQVWTGGPFPNDEWFFGIGKVHMSPGVGIATYSNWLGIVLVGRNGDDGNHVTWDRNFNYDRAKYTNSEGLFAGYPLNFNGRPCINSMTATAYAHVIAGCKLDTWNFEPSTGRHTSTDRLLYSRDSGLRTVYINNFALTAGSGSTRRPFMYSNWLIMCPSTTNTVNFGIAFCGRGWVARGGVFYKNPGDNFASGTDWKIAWAYGGQADIPADAVTNYYPNWIAYSELQDECAGNYTLGNYVYFTYGDGSNEMYLTYFNTNGTYTGKERLNAPTQFANEIFNANGNYETFPWHTSRVYLSTRMNKFIFTRDTAAGITYVWTGQLNTNNRFSINSLKRIGAFNNYYATTDMSYCYGNNTIYLFADKIYPLTDIVNEPSPST